MNKKINLLANILAKHFLELDNPGGIIIPGQISDWITCPVFWVDLLSNPDKFINMIALYEFADELIRENIEWEIKKKDMEEKKRKKEYAKRAKENLM